MERFFVYLMLFSSLFHCLLSGGSNEAKILDDSTEEKHAESAKRVVSCVSLLQAKFETNKADIADELIVSPHKDKELLYNKYYYATLKYCILKLSNEQINEAYQHLNEEHYLSKMKIKALYHNDYNDRILKDLKSSLDLDKEEIIIKEFIDKEITNEPIVEPPPYEIPSKKIIKNENNSQKLPYSTFMDPFLEENKYFIFFSILIMFSIYGIFIWSRERSPKRKLYYKNLKEKEN